MFSELYDRVQGRPLKISTRWLRDQVIDLTAIASVREQWTGAMDESSVRGCYIEGPLGPPIPLADNEVLIVLARSLDREWRRFVYTKELMHAFDTPDEKTDTEEKFDIQIEKFGDPTAETSPQFRAEVTAFWRALAVFCPEEDRLQFKIAFDNNEMSGPVVATRLGIPTVYTEHLFRDDYLGIIDHVK